MDGTLTPKNKKTTIMKMWNVIPRQFCLAALVLAAAGCIREDLSNCPPPGPNVKIDFTLFDPQSLFTDEIESVIAVLFDQQGTYIPPATTLDKAALDRYPGVEMALDPGGYRMVFWANVGNNTEIKVVDGVPVITYKNLDGTVEQVLGNGDPVWYAPAVPASTTRVDTNAQPLEHYEFTVTAGDDYTDQVAFTQTHNSVNVYVHGLPLDAASMPTVEITGLACAADFYGMAPLEEPLPCVTSAVQTVITQKDDVDYALAAFETSPLGGKTGMDLVIKDAAGSEIFRTSLTDAIAQSGVDPDAHELNILVDFTDYGSAELDFTVVISEWEDDNLVKNF